MQAKLGGRPNAIARTRLKPQTAGRSRESLMLASPTVRFALFASASAATISVLMAFWPLWLTSRGLDATEIGVLGAVGLWVRGGATPLLGMLADHSGKPWLGIVLPAGAS